MLKFANDIKVFRVISDEQVQYVFQSTLDKLIEWSERWQMKFLMILLEVEITAVKGCETK